MRFTSAAFWIFPQWPLLSISLACSWTSRVAQPPPALISSSCGNFQKHVLVSHNESFSDCHGWIVWGNDNFDANLLIIHRRNRRLRILGKTGPFYEQNWLYTYVCNQWSLVMALCIIWLQLGQLVHKNGISSHRLVHHQLWMTLLYAYFGWVR